MTSFLRQCGDLEAVRRIAEGRSADVQRRSAAVEGRSLLRRIAERRSAAV